MHFFPIPHPFLFLPFPPLPYLFHPSYLPSVFIQYFLLHPFPGAQLSLSSHSTFCTFFSFRPIPVFSLLVPTSKSRHNFSFFCTLSSQLLGNFFCHTPLILLVVSGFFDSLPSFLLVCVFVPFTRLYIHPSFFWS
jgi:hypothetical protein